MPPSSHFIFIPIVLILGVVIGFVMGARATRDQIGLEARQAEERAKKRADRAAARVAGDGGPPTA